MDFEPINPCDIINVTFGIKINLTYIKTGCKITISVSSKSVFFAGEDKYELFVIDTVSVYLLPVMRTVHACR